VPKSDVNSAATESGIDAQVLEGVCRFESGNGKFLTHHNRNGTWDVGYCQNHRYFSGNKHPRVPTVLQSVKEAAKELKYWKKQHNRFCVKLRKETGKCGFTRGSKWIGIKNCQRKHHWYHHYNSGFKGNISSGYGDRVHCFIKNKFKRCTKKQWKSLRRETFN